MLARESLHESEPTHTGLIGLNLSAAAIYLLVAASGIALASLSPGLPPVWPAAGFALAIMLMWGYGTCIGVAIGAFFAYRLHHRWR